MRLSDLQSKEIIDITTGKRIGMIIDVEVDNTGRIKKFILQEKRLRRFKTLEEFAVTWDEIIKFGDDIILIDPRNRKNNY